MLRKCLRLLAVFIRRKKSPRFPFGRWVSMAIARQPPKIYAVQSVPPLATSVAAEEAWLDAGLRATARKLAAEAKAASEHVGKCTPNGAASRPTVQPDWSGK